MGQQNPTTNLTVSKGGTIIHQVATIVLEGALSVSINPAEPRVATIVGTGGSVAVGAHSLFGNPGTAAGAGTNVSVGSGLTLTAGGSLEATGGGGDVFVDGLGINVDTVSNPGTVTINNTGTIVLPAATDTAALGVDIRGGNVTNTGTGGITLPSNYFYGGNQTITGTGYGAAGNFESSGGAVYKGTAAAYGGFMRGYGANVNPGGTFTGGGFLFSGGPSAPGIPGYGGNFLIAGGNGDLGGGGINLQAGVGAQNGVIMLGVAGGGTLALQLANLHTGDPGTLGAVFQGATANLLGYFGLYRSQG